MFREKIPIQGIAITFRDVILLPGKSHVDPVEVDVSTKVTRRHVINIPLISSPMDTVTEYAMAIALARLGGVGVIHRNLTIEEEVEMVRRVKEAPVYPISLFYLEPHERCLDALRKLRNWNVDYTPVVEGGRVVGFISRSDLVRCGNDVVHKHIRPPITASINAIPNELIRLMRENNVDIVALTREDGSIMGVVTYYDLAESQSGVFRPALDEEGRLLVGAAISPFDLERAVKLAKYADFLVTDVAHIHNVKALEATKRLVKTVGVEVVIGNVGTYEGAVDVITTIEDVGGFRVGIASGSICTTGIVTGVAAPTLWATAQVADAAWDYGLKDVPVIADGGIREPGDAVKAFVLGAWAVMAGRLFAQCDESPSPIVRIGMRRYKFYRGMASEGARRRRFAIDRYGVKVKDIEEGVEGLVPYKGPVSEVVREFVAGIQASLGYIGARSIKEAWEKGRIALITSLGKSEIEPHDLKLDLG